MPINHKSIILTGFARSGKNTVADILSDKYGHPQIAFADPVREALLALNPIIRLDLIDELEEGGFGNMYRVAHLADIVERVGWEGAKKYEDVRVGLQRMGTEVGRNMFGLNVWVKKALEKVRDMGPVVFTDARFDNEAIVIKVRTKSEVWKIDRGLHPLNNHSSESGISPQYIDKVIPNMGTVEQLRVAVMEAYEL